MPEPNSNNADERITIRRGGQAATMLSRSSNAGIKSLRLSVGGHQFFSSGCLIKFIITDAFKELETKDWKLILKVLDKLPEKKWRLVMVI